MNRLKFLRYALGLAALLGVIIYGCNKEEGMQPSNDKQLVKNGVAEVSNPEVAVSEEWLKQATENKVVQKKSANAARPYGVNYPISLGSLWADVSGSVPVGTYKYYSIDRSILDPASDYYVVVENVTGVTTVFVYYGVNGVGYYVPDNDYNPVYYTRATGKSFPIGFNNSGIEKVKRNIPATSSKVYIAVYGNESSTFRLKVYAKSVKYDVKWISQYKKGCGTDGFDNSYCGPTSYEIIAAFLTNRTPCTANVFPTGICGDSKKTPVSASD